MLRHIEVTIKRYEREKITERSQNHGERADLHTERGLSDPGPEADGGAGGGTAGQVREDAQAASEGAPAILFQKLVLEGKLYPHLREIDETAHRRLSEMMPQMAKEAGVTEALKAADPMKWAGLMNTLKAQAEEIILNELVFS